MKRRSFLKKAISGLSIALGLELPRSGEMAKAVKIKFDPFDKQVGPLISESQVTMAVAGARGGKSKFGAARMIFDGLTQEDYHEDDIKAGLPYVCAIGAPTFPMLQRIILPTFLAMIPQEVIIGRYHETRRRLRVRGPKGETHFYFLSGVAPFSWMGLSLYRVWLDEFAQFKESLYDEVRVRLSDRKGRTLLTGTPQGPNWAYTRLYQPYREWQAMPDEERAVDLHHPGAEIDFYHWRTVDNPHIDREFIEQKRRSMSPRFFRRTFEATWDTFEGQVYEEFLREIHVKPARDYKFKLPNGRMVGRGPNLVPLVRLVAGVDWGFAPGHAGVIIVGGQDTAGRWWIVEESVSEQLLVKADLMQDSWIMRAMALRTKWGIERFYCDTEAPANIKMFRDVGLKADHAVKDVTDGIECVSKFMHIDDELGEPMMYILDCCSVTCDEATYYHWQEGKEKPEKVNDNTMDGLRYMVHTDNLRGRFKREPNYQM